MKELQNTEAILKAKNGKDDVISSNPPSSSKLKGKWGNKRKKSNKKGLQQQVKKSKDGLETQREIFSLWIEGSLEEKLSELPSFQKVK